MGDKLGAIPSSIGCVGASSILVALLSTPQTILSVDDVRHLPYYLWQTAEKAKVPVVPPLVENETDFRLF